MGELLEAVVAAAAAARGDSAAEAREALRRGLESARSEAPIEAMREAARLCESAGLVAEAVLACRLVLERDPRDLETWRKLADLHSERGDVERARHCRARARAIELPEPAAPQPSPPGSGATPAVAPDDDPWTEAGTADPGGGEGDDGRDVPLSFSSADLARFLALFSGREDVHARQWFDAARGRGGYAPVAEPLGPAALRAHLRGRVTLGVYVLRKDETVRFCVLDLDVARSAMEEAAGDALALARLRRRLDAVAGAAARELRALGLPFLSEDSGWKGRHYWIFFDEAIPAQQAVDFGAALLPLLPSDVPDVHLEFFPKQARLLGRGLGNLVKLPLGIHKANGRRAWILNENDEIEPRPFEALRRLRLASGLALRDATERLRAQAAAAPEGPAAGPARPALRLLPAETGEAGAEAAAQPETEPAPDKLPRRAPRPVEPPWTAEDFDRDPGFRAVLGGCAVLRRLVQRASADDDLVHDELVTLCHTLGHLQNGPRGVNYLLARVPGAGPEQRVLRRYRGSPASCDNIRRKLPGLCSQVPCNCAFGARIPTYPNPLLHLDGEERTLRLVVLEGEGRDEDATATDPGLLPVGAPEPDGEPEP